MPTPLLEPLRLEDVPAAAALIVRAFLAHEPTSRCLGLVEEVLLPFTRAYCQRAAEEGLGVVAREAGTGDLLGALACLDLLEDVRDRWPELQDSRFDAKLPDLAFMATLEGPFTIEQGYVPGQCAHVAQVAVAEGAGGRGLAQALIGRACELARERGYSRIAAVCTTDASRRAHEKAGFQVVRTLRYDAHEYEGRRVFASLEGSCALLVRRLDGEPARGQFH